MHKYAYYIAYNSIQRTNIAYSKTVNVNSVNTGQPAGYSSDSALITVAGAVTDTLVHSHSFIK